MSQKYAVYITGGIWPLDNGARMHSYGQCREFSKVLPLKLFTCADRMYTKKEMGLEDYDNIEVHIHVNGAYHPINNILAYWNAKASASCALYTDWMDEIECCVRSEQCKYIIIDQIIMHGYFSYLKRKYPTKKFIYISHNVEYLNNYSKYFLKNGRLSFAFNKKNVKNLGIYLTRKAAEKELIGKSDFIFSISPDDIKIFKEKFKYEGEFIFSKPLIQFNKAKSIDDMEKFNYRLMFIGSMYWYPNVRGIEWFADNVLERLIKHDQRYIFYAVGRKPDKALYALKDRFKDNFVLTGDVDDISEYYQKGDVSIISIFEGMGTKIKVLEAIGSGIPTVSTSFAAAAYDIKDEIMIADTADDFYNAIVRLETDRELRKALFLKMEKYYDNYMNLSGEIIRILSA